MSKKIAIARLIKNGWQNFRRNVWLSAAAIAVMTVTLSVISILIVLSFLTNLSLDNIKERVDISVYFQEGTQEQMIQDVRSDLEGIPQVANVSYISAEEAYLEFQERHSDDPLIIDALRELTDNPFYPTLVVKAHNIDDYSTIAEQLASKDISEIEKVNFEDNRRAIETLGRLTNGITKGGSVLALLFAIVSVLVMYNTIRLTIYNRKEEIEIMRLVGATNAYVRWPFIIEGIFYGIAGVIITTAVLLPVLSSFIPRINDFLGISLNLTSINSTLLWQIVGFELLLGLLLGILSSWFAVRKYLKE